MPPERHSYFGLKAVDWSGKRAAARRLDFTSGYIKLGSAVVNHAVFHIFRKPASAPAISTV
jgi:hypothetical protein